MRCVYYIYIFERQKERSRALPSPASLPAPVMARVGLRWSWTHTPAMCLMPTGTQVTEPSLCPFWIGTSGKLDLVSAPPLCDVGILTAKLSTHFPNKLLNQSNK